MLPPNRKLTRDPLYDTGLRLSSQLLEHPKDVTLLGKYATLLYYQGKEPTDYSALISMSDRWINDNLEDSQIWSVRGMAFQRLGNYTKALSCYERAMELDPLDVRSAKNATDIHEFLLKKSSQKLRLR